MTIIDKPVTIKFDDEEEEALVVDDATLLARSSDVFRSLLGEPATTPQELGPLDDNRDAFVWFLEALRLIRVSNVFPFDKEHPQEQQLRKVLPLSLKYATHRLTSALLNAVDNTVAKRTDVHNYSALFLAAEKILKEHGHGEFRWSEKCLRSIGVELIWRDHRDPDRRRRLKVDFAKAAKLRECTLCAFGTICVDRDFDICPCYSTRAVPNVVCMDRWLLS